MDKPHSSELEAGRGGSSGGSATADKSPLGNHEAMSDHDRHQTRLLLWKLDTRYASITSSTCPATDSFH